MCWRECVRVWMRMNGWRKKIARARGMMQPYCPPEELYLAFLIYRLPQNDLEDLISYLKFSRTVAQTLRDTLNLKNELSSLAEPELAPSRIYHCLHQYSQNAILVNLVVSDFPLIRQRIEFYLNKLRYVHTALTGDDLLRAGIASGSRIKEILELLREARLDGKAETKEQELAMIRSEISNKKALS